MAACRVQTWGLEAQATGHGKCHRKHTAWRRPGTAPTARKEAGQTRRGARQNRGEARLAASPAQAGWNSSGISRTLRRQGACLARGTLREMNATSGSNAAGTESGLHRPTHLLPLDRKRPATDHDQRNKDGKAQQPHEGEATEEKQKEVGAPVSIDIFNSAHLPEGCPRMRAEQKNHHGHFDKFLGAPLNGHKGWKSLCRYKNKRRTHHGHSPWAKVPQTRRTKLGNSELRIVSLETHDRRMIHPASSHKAELCHAPQLALCMGWFVASWLERRGLLPPHHPL